MPGGFDPSGYVKGWAAQMRSPRSAPAASAASWSTPPATSPAAAARQTARPSGSASPIPVRRYGWRRLSSWPGAIATSGTYERGDHLIDPHSGRSAARAASASVTGPDLGLADALATAVAVAGEPGLELIEKLDGYEALIINSDGSRQRTKRFPVAAA